MCLSNFSVPDPVLGWAYVQLLRKIQEPTDRYDVQALEKGTPEGTESMDIEPFVFHFQIQGAPQPKVFLSFEFWEADGCAAPVHPYLLAELEEGGEEKLLKVSFSSGLTTVCTPHCHFCLVLLPPDLYIFTHVRKESLSLVGWLFHCRSDPAGSGSSGRAWKPPQGKNDLIGMEWVFRFGNLSDLTGFCQQREPQGWERKIRPQGLKGNGGSFRAMFLAVQRYLWVKFR